MAKQYSKPPEMQIETNRTYKVLIKTNKGDIKLELNPAEAPITVNNFVTLARDGFYDGVTFHRVVLWPARRSYRTAGPSCRAFGEQGV